MTQVFRIEMDRGIDGKMDRVGRGLNKALVLTLTDSAKFGNEEFLHDLPKAIDRPNNFTLAPSGQAIVVARFGAASPFSEAHVRPKQAAYMDFILRAGGVRGLGDAGASLKHAFVPGQREGFSLPGSYSERLPPVEIRRRPELLLLEPLRQLEERTVAQDRTEVFRRGRLLQRRTHQASAVGIQRTAPAYQGIDDKKTTGEETRRRSGRGDNWLDKRGVYRRERGGDLRAAN